MDSRTRYAKVLTHSPLGSAFLSQCVHSGLSVSEVSDSVVTLHLFARAAAAVSPWRQEYSRAAARHLERGPRFRELAVALLAQPGTAWWFSPPNSNPQIWYEEHAQDKLRTIGGVIAPNRSPTDWERYAQKPEWGIYTSTELGGTAVSSLLLGSQLMIGDLGPLHVPVKRWRVKPTSKARIYSVDGPERWRDLCIRYPAHYEHGQIVPDFVRVSHDWDAVHVSFGAILTGSQVRIGKSDEWTMLSGWDAEATVWLRSVFDRVEHLPDLRHPVPVPPLFE